MEKLVCALAFLVTFLCSGVEVATAAQANEPAELELREKLGMTAGDQRLPGIALAEGVSQMTGVAISPLLGVSAIGSWTYFRTPESERDLLPWVCHPLFWGIGFGILLICFFKDSIGNFAPAFVKKPLDFLELFEDKFSAVIAGTAFIPFLVEQHSLYRDGLPAISAHSVSGSGMASIPSPTLAAVDPIWILTPLALVGFFVVWIVSHAITVIIALSPFKLLDIFLKSARLGLLFLMTSLYFISPVLVAILSCFIIVICAFLAPSAFRMSVYGTIISFDFIRSLLWKAPFNSERIWCFLAKRGSKTLKTRSLGLITFDAEEQVVLSSRWLFVGKNRVLSLGKRENLVLTHGLLFPTIQRADSDTKKLITVIHLLPRFRHCSRELATHLGIEFREGSIVRGYRAAKDWISDTLRPSRLLPENSSSTGESS